MSKEKQIEEIVADINEMQNGGWEFVGDSEYTTDVSNEELAEHLYNAGYRKQSENTVEVVRCKDCKRFLKMETSPSYDGKCLGYGYLVEAKHYCSYGEPEMKGGEE